MIFVFFKPLEIKEQEFIDIPLFELRNFTMHELKLDGLKTFIAGEKATRYSDRYTVQEIDYTDNSKKYIANMKAFHGVYKDDFVDLSGSVVYTREDGLIFETEKMSYNKIDSIIRTDSVYKSYRDKDIMIGDYLEYNTLKDQIKSKNIEITYQLKEKNI